MLKNKIEKKISMVALTILLALPSFMTKQESDFANWLISIGNKKINSKWNIHNDIQYRNYSAIGDLEQLLPATGLS